MLAVGSHVKKQDSVKIQNDFIKKDDILKLINDKNREKLSSEFYSP